MTGDAEVWTDGDATGPLSRTLSAHRLHWKRRRRLWRAFRSRHDLTPVIDRTGNIRVGQILAFSTIRNEMARLPAFLDHYRRLGVDNFLIVDNASTDESRAFLSGQPDISLWLAEASYRQSRFGADWLGWLQMKHGHGHWCLTVDADELLIYPHWDSRPLPDLCGWLEKRGTQALGALMLDLYPREKLSGGLAARDPLETLQWFDAGPHRARRHPRFGALQVQGGVRDRVFFVDTPELAPTLNKLPLVKWNRHHVYMNSTHSMLPAECNRAYDGPGDSRASGILLHTKFLPGIVDRSTEEKSRKQHFTNPENFDRYYDDIIGQPALWCGESVRYQGWQQLVDLGLMSAGGWP